MSDEVVIYQCSNIGVSGTTPVHVKRLGGTFTARCGISIMGAMNMNAAEFEACGYNPFSDDFRDNYAEGVGATEQEALAALKADMKHTATSLWA